MNLNAVAANIVSAINPFTRVQILQSLGNTTRADGGVVPAYSDPIPVDAQIQAKSQGGLRQSDGVNMQGSHRSIYINGTINGASRPYLKGGDLVILPDNSTWLVTMTDEPWGQVDGWTHATITLQNDTNLGP